MFYSKDYHRATEEAARVFVENGITAFPLNPVRLANRAGIKILPYDRFAELTAVGRDRLLELSGDGFSTCLEKQFFIIYNDDIRPRSRRRWTLLHEYCHIRLGHVPVTGGLLPSYPNERCLEAAADELTSCLIAPLPLLFLCRIENEAELTRCFGLSGQAAANTFAAYRKYRRMDLSPELGYGDALDNFRRFSMEYVWKKEKASLHQHYRSVDVDVE